MIALSTTVFAKTVRVLVIDARCPDTPCNAAYCKVINVSHKGLMKSYIRRLANY